MKDQHGLKLETCVLIQLAIMLPHKTMSILFFEKNTMKLLLA